MNLAPEGTHEAVAVAADFAISNNEKRTPSIRVRFRLKEKFNGATHHALWRGYLTDAAVERTIESLRHMGWKGTDLYQLAAISEEACSRLLPSPVDLVIVHREFEDNRGEVRAALEVKFVNSSSSGRQLVKPENSLSTQQLALLSNRLRGLCAKTATASAPTGDNLPEPDPSNGEAEDDFPSLF